jgi:hypothetical protein
MPTHIQLNACVLRRAIAANALSATELLASPPTPAPAPTAAAAAAVATNSACCRNWLLKAHMYAGAPLVSRIVNNQL